MPHAWRLTEDTAEALYIKHEKWDVGDVRGCEVVQGHACGERRPEHGRCRRVWPQGSAPHEARSGVDVCALGYGCLRGM
jgi:hypothetical protein